MTSLVVVVAPPGPLDGIGDALADWSAAGLTAPMLWIDSQAWQGRSTSQTPALLLHAGRRVGTTLESTLTGQQFERVRLVVLVPAIAGAPGVDSQTEHAIHQAALNTSAVQQIELLRCIVTRPDSGPVAADLAREGWHNVIIAPEESRGPGLGHSTLVAATDPLTIGPDAAAAIAGLTGLWANLPQAPLDGIAAPFGRTLRLARSYYRNLDASAIADHIRSEVMSTGDPTARTSVPLPRQHGTEAVYIDDAPLAANDMATTVLRRHAGLFRGERVSPAPVNAEKIGAWQAIRMLFGFLWASLSMAPMKWYSLVVGNTSSAIAKGVQSQVFGQDPSSYAVVAEGELAGGKADWRDVGRASANLDQLLDNGGPRTHEIAGDFTPVWSDYVEAGMTLVDAGERSGNLPIQVGTERGVLRRMSDCVPGPEEAFTAIGPRVAAAIGISSVRAADPLGMHTLQLRLRGLGSQPSLARDADATLRELEQWQATHQHSYAARTGAMIGQQLLRTSEEVTGLIGRVQNSGAVDVSNRTTELRQKRIASWMRGLLGSFGGLAVVAVVLGFVGILTWWSVLVAALIGVVCWLGGSLGLFLIGQRDLFADLNRRRSAISAAEADQANLRTAMRDLRRQSEAYGQFLEWTRVLGTVLHQPFGRAAEAGQSLPVIEEGLPRTARVGVATVRPEAASEVVNLLRRDVYTTGWLSGPWQAVFGDAGRRLGPQAADLRSDPRKMFAQRAGVAESWLTVWADLLEAEGVGNAAGEQLWQYAMQRLGQGNYAQQMVAEVKLAGQDQLVSADEFMAGLGEANQAAQSRGQRFDDKILSREARLDGGAAQVVQSWPQDRSDHLSRQAVLVQLSEGLPDYTFDLGEQVPASPTGPQASSLVPEDPFAGQRPSDTGEQSDQTVKRPRSAPDAGWVF